MTKSEGNWGKVDIVVFTMPQQLAIKKSWCLCWPANDCNSSLSCLEVGALRRRKKFFGAIIFGLGKKQLWEEKNPFVFLFSFCCPRFWLVLLQAKLQGERIKKIIFPPTTLEGAETKQLSPTHLYSECFQKCLQTITQILQHSRQEYFVEMKNLGQHLCGV